MFSHNDTHGLIFNIQKFSIHDGPGIRTTVFLKGCGLKCVWCHNPEGQAPYPEVGFLSLRCIDCRKCLATCKIGAISVDESTKEKVIDRDLCTGCGMCVDACPSTALERVGRSMSVEEVLKEVQKDEAFYARSKGGVTVSGGEPLDQLEFTYELLSGCKAKGIHTALETGGNVSWKHLTKVARVTDLILYDIKHMDTKKHRLFTGVGNELILENAERLSSAGRPIIIRVPVIPMHNDSEENIKHTAEFAAGLKTVEQVELLPYHSLAESKYKKLSRRYRLSGTEPPSMECMEQLKRIVNSSFHVTVQL